MQQRDRNPDDVKRFMHQDFGHDVHTSFELFLATMKKRQIFGIMGASLIFIVFINFMVFAGISSYLGGGPDYDKSIGGKYYLTNHGRQTEVSENVFTYIEWHFIITWFLAILSILIIMLSLVIHEVFEKQKQHKKGDG